MSEEFEKLVINSAKDVDAFTRLVQLVQNDLYRIAQTRLENNEDINDAIQETMIIAYKSIQKLESPRYFKTWIIRILINECNRIYKNKNRRFFALEKVVLLKRHENFKINETDITNIENKIDLEQAFKILSYEERLCLVLFYNSNYSAIEISEILHTNVNTIKSRITRAKQKIKKYFEGGVENETARR